MELRKRLRQKIDLLPEIINLEFFYNHKFAYLKKETNKSGVIYLYAYKGLSLYNVGEDLDFINSELGLEILMPGLHDFFGYDIEIIKETTIREVANILYKAYDSFMESKIIFVNSKIFDLYDRRRYK